MPNGYIIISGRKGELTDKMSGRGKQIVSLLLAAGLAIGLLGGCGKSGKEGDGGTAGSSAAAERGVPAESAPPDGDGPKAMGRYRETEVVLPDGVKDQTLIQFMEGEGGFLELYTADTELPSGKVKDSFRYVLREGNWEKDEDWAGNTLLKDMGIDFSYITYGGDGRYYLGGTDENYQYHLFQVEENGMANELLADVFKPGDGRDYGMIPPKFEVLENGNVLLYDYYQIDVYTPSGKCLYSVAKDFSGTTSDARGFSQGNELVTVQDGVIIKCSIDDGSVLETLPIDEIKGNREGMELFGDGAGGIYAANEEGLSHVSQGGTLWEVLIDGSLNHMGMRSLYMKRFLPGDKGDFYGVFVNEGGMRGVMMFRYEYDSDMEAVPPQSITVYSLKDHSTVRQAASLFQSQHPEVKVEVRTAVENGESVTEEMIQGLNTELLGGKGADVLILDGLPAASYMEKGILADLSSLMEELEASGDIPANILQGFADKDGAVYQIPARISFPMVIGKEQAAKAFSSLQSMAGYPGENPLLPAENYENLLRMTANLRYEELFLEKDSLTREKLIEYLEAVKAVGEAGGAKTVFAEEETERDLVTNYVRENGILGTSIHYDMGKSDCGIECVDGYGDLCIPVQIKEQNPGSVMVPAGKVYLPSILAGVNHAGGKEELAMEFIRCLLSLEVQKEELYDGFPVNPKAMKILAENDKPGYAVSSGYGDYYVSGQWPSREVRTEVMEMMEGLTVPALVDETVMGMIVEGSKEYYEGKETSGQAADKIMRKLSVYQAE